MKSFPRERDGGRELEGKLGWEPEGGSEMQNKALERPEQKTSFLLPDQTVLSLYQPSLIYFSSLEKEISKVVRERKSALELFNEPE